MLGNGVKAAVAHAQAAVDALVLVDGVRAFDGAGDSIHRAVAGAESAALALVGINLKVDEVAAYSGRAALLHHMGDILIPEVFQGGQHRIGGGLAQGAQGGVLQVVAQLLDGVQVLQGALAIGDLAQQVVQPLGADPAGDALAAGLVHAELQEELGDVHHTVVLVHDDQAAGAHHGANGGERVIVDGGVDELGGDTAAGGAAGLGGKITNTGLVEIPMGTTLRTIIEDIGGGIPNGKKFKAAQTGGPSGGCIPASLIDTPMDYDSLGAIGSMMGSGGLIVMDEDNCMVDIAKFFLEFIIDESCGKCSPCRIGTKRLYDLLTKITEGNGTMEDLATIEELCEHIKSSALCGLGQTAPNPVLSTLHHFRDEYIAHVVEKRCPAGVCKNLLHFVIDPGKCKGCTLCAKNCPANAIMGAVKAPHVIDPNKCIKCGACMDNCRFGAISKH